MLYKGSPANVNILGIPLLKIVSPLVFGVMVFLTWEVWHYPALALSGDTGNRWYIPAFMGGIVVVGLLIYYVGRAVRRRQGIDVDLVYRELPPRLTARNAQRPRGRQGARPSRLTGPRGSR